MNEFHHTLCLKQGHGEADEFYWHRIGVTFDLDGNLLLDEYRNWREIGYPKSEARDTVLQQYGLLPYEAYLRDFVLT